ncbi:PEP/pyruvate-binding domain-containing protein [Blastococcus sp. VKM Ac-2987]|uniref:PEP/pyruvate-binding domain-containing protein n=1 Tax=Blastococcus sp. VKM Ac-2987 TaxID=3004141 RepID=UPI0022ABB40D|nr:PEP/pyruvate-binding domain-containing protein [Blastococcus sp. VKM Ac-2987]MCZ2857294.1 PEP-utilizing enzyme [Blastococcus sp. VKM Ac-2987]
MSATSTDGGSRAAPPTDGPPVVALDDGAATDDRLTGAKASALARASAQGLPIVPGFVITTTAVERLADGAPLPDEVLAAWGELTGDGRRSLVVRSSSTVEDLGDSSMAGRFESVVGVDGPEEFRRAVDVVIASRETAAAGSDTLTGREPLAVLVQPLLDARSGGVLFGIDPVSGREDRLVVAAVSGGPDRLVSGDVDGDRYELDRSGRRTDVTRGDGGVRLRRPQLQALADLARRTARVFGGPQDVEWAFDEQGRLRLLQSRPVTAEGRGRPVGPVLGPGPVAETFPEPLQPLEADLWLPPLREALRHALLLAGTADRAAVDDSPLVTVLGGWPAVDLDLLESRQETPRLRERLDPRPRLRRLRASWRVGRLRSALPLLARDVLDSTDHVLGGVPPLGDLSDRQLVAVLHRVQPALRSVHAHEVLMGMLVDPAAPRLTGVSAALRVLARSRQAGLTDAEIVAANPVVLALAAPRICAGPQLPSDVDAPDSAPPGDETDAGLLREALRLRVRWLQEVSARAAWTLGERLTAAGRLGGAEQIRGIRLADLAAAVHDPDQVLRPLLEEPGEPLPARFRESDTGRPVPVTGTSGGTGAGGGSGTGPVHHGEDPPEGSVLVVRTLDPSLAPVLPRLAGLVAETGSVLAHLAILARESGVPTVVGYSGALDQFPPGTTVRVDGDTGAVEEETS